MRNIIQEKLRHPGFNINDFKEMDDAEVMIAYCEDYLTKLGKGSSRVAFRYSSKYALKIAINNAGVSQNEEEVNVYTNPKTKNIVAEIGDYDRDFFGYYLK